MTAKNSSSTLHQIPASIWVLGFVSMLMDISSKMIHSLLPLFMVSTLGASALAVGLVEGLAESTALIVKVFSGRSATISASEKGLPCWATLWAHCPNRCSRWPLRSALC